MPVVSFWAVAQTETQREHAVRLLLMRANCETYLPRIRVRNRITPLFPGYLFVRVSQWRWYFVMWTPHVIRLLMAGDQPAQLSEDFVSQIRKREHNGLVRLPIRRLKKGQKVRIVRGSFEGQIGLYDGMSGRDRERVLLELLGQVVPVELPAKDIRPLDIASVSRGTCY
jgi:transcriptional antiterminator RfaH